MPEAFQYLSQKLHVHCTLFLKNYTTCTLEGAVSHNALYYRQLSIACYQVNFYAKNYSE